MKRWSISTNLRRESWWLLGALAVLLACIWPVRTLQKLPMQQRALQQQGMQVRALAQEAEQLKAQIVPTATAPAAQLQALVEQHLTGKGSAVVTGDAAVITLRSVPGGQLGRMVTALRQELHAQVQQLQVTVQDGVVNGQMELSLPEAR